MWPARASRNPQHEPVGRLCWMRAGPCSGPRPSWRGRSQPPMPAAARARARSSSSPSRWACRWRAVQEVRRAARSRSEEARVRQRRAAASTMVSASLGVPRGRCRDAQADLVRHREVSRRPRSSRPPSRAWATASSRSAASSPSRATCATCGAGDDRAGRRQLHRQRQLRRQAARLQDRRRRMDRHHGGGQRRPGASSSWRSPGWARCEARCAAWLRSGACDGHARVAAGASAEAPNYAIDPTHTFVNYEIRPLRHHHQPRPLQHQGRHAVLRPRRHAAARSRSSIDIRSVNTGVDFLNRQIQGKDFFNVADYPTGTFVVGQVRLQRRQGQRGARHAHAAWARPTRWC